MEPQLGCKKALRYVQYSPKNGCNSFVQSAVNAEQKGDKNLDSNDVAGTKKLLANESYNC